MTFSTKREFHVKLHSFGMDESPAVFKVAYVVKIKLLFYGLILLLFDNTN